MSPDSARVDAARRGSDCHGASHMEGSMMRDLHILTVGLVFLFLGAIVAGVF